MSKVCGPWSTLAYIATVSLLVVLSLAGAGATNPQNDEYDGYAKFFSKHSFDNTSRIKDFSSAFGVTNKNGQIVRDRTGINRNMLSGNMSDGKVFENANQISINNSTVDVMVNLKDALRNTELLKFTKRIQVRHKSKDKGNSISNNIAVSKFVRNISRTKMNDIRNNAMAPGIIGYSSKSKRSVGVFRDVIKLKDKSGNVTNIYRNIRNTKNGSRIPENTLNNFRYHRNTTARNFINFGKPSENRKIAFRYLRYHRDASVDVRNYLRNIRNHRNSSRNRRNTFRNHLVTSEIATEAYGNIRNSRSSRNPFENHKNTLRNSRQHLRTSETIENTSRNIPKITRNIRNHKNSSRKLKNNLRNSRYHRDTSEDVGNYPKKNKIDRGKSGNIPKTTRNINRSRTSKNTFRDHLRTPEIIRNTSRNTKYLRNTTKNHENHLKKSRYPRDTTSQNAISKNGQKSSDGGAGIKCGGRLTAAKGVISTPGFPGKPPPTSGTSSAPLVIHCTWVIVNEANTGNIIVYLTQLYAYTGVTFTEYSYYDDDDDDVSADDDDVEGGVGVGSGRHRMGARRAHTVTEENVTQVKSIEVSAPYLVVEYRTTAAASASGSGGSNDAERPSHSSHGNDFGQNIRALDGLLDVYGFNVTYEVRRHESAGDDVTSRHRCSVLECRYLGHCLANADFSRYECACFDGYSGPDCGQGPLCNNNNNNNNNDIDNNIDNDINSPTTATSGCENGATCRHLGSVAVTCQCTPGYTGDKCDVPLVVTAETNRQQPGRQPQQGPQPRQDSSAAPTAVKDCSESTRDDVTTRACPCQRTPRPDVARYAVEFRLSNATMFYSAADSATTKTSTNNKNNDSATSGSNPDEIEATRRFLARELPANLPPATEITDLNVLNLRPGTRLLVEFYGPWAGLAQITDALGRVTSLGWLGRLPLCPTCDTRVEVKREPTIHIYSVEVNRPKSAGRYHQRQQLQQQLIFQGEEFILSCTAQASRRAVFRWYKDGVFINVTRATRSMWTRLTRQNYNLNSVAGFDEYWNENATLTDRPPLYTAMLGVRQSSSEMDSGVYSCRVEDPKMRQLNRRHVVCRHIAIKVVESGPRIRLAADVLMSVTSRGTRRRNEGEMGVVTVFKGDSLLIKCLSQRAGYRYHDHHGGPSSGPKIGPTMGYSWTKDGRLFPYDPGQEFWEDLRPDGSLLRISNAQHSHTYTCHVTNSMAAASKSILVTVVTSELDSKNGHRISVCPAQIHRPFANSPKMRKFDRDTPNHENIRPNNDDSRFSSIRDGDMNRQRHFFSGSEDVDVDKSDLDVAKFNGVAKRFQRNIAEAEYDALNSSYDVIGRSYDVKIQDVDVNTRNVDDVNTDADVDGPNYDVIPESRNANKPSSDVIKRSNDVMNHNNVDAGTPSHDVNDPSYDVSLNVSGVKNLSSDVIKRSSDVMNHKNVDVETSGYGAKDPNNDVINQNVDAGTPSYDVNDQNNDVMYQNDVNKSSSYVISPNNVDAIKTPIDDVKDSMHDVISTNYDAMKRNYDVNTPHNDVNPEFDEFEPNSDVKTSTHGLKDPNFSATKPNSDPKIIHDSEISFSNLKNNDKALLKKLAEPQTTNKQKRHSKITNNNNLDNSNIPGSDDLDKITQSFDGGNIDFTGNLETFWPITAAGVKSGSECPEGYTGTAQRLCEVSDFDHIYDDIYDDDMGSTEDLTKDHQTPIHDKNFKNDLNVDNGNVRNYVDKIKSERFVGYVSNYRNELNHVDDENVDIVDRKSAKNQNGRKIDFTYGTEQNYDQENANYGKTDKSDDINNYAEYGKIKKSDNVDYEKIGANYGREENVNNGRENMNYDREYANYGQSDANYVQKGANYDQKDLNYDQKHVDYDQKRSNSDQKRSNSDQSDVNYGQKQVKYDQKDANYDQRDANYDQKSANYDQKRSNSDQSDVNYEQIVGKSKLFHIGDGNKMANQWRRVKRQTMENMERDQDVIAGGDRDGITTTTTTSEDHNRMYVRWAEPDYSHCVSRHLQKFIRIYHQFTSGLDTMPISRFLRDLTQEYLNRDKRKLLRGEYERVLRLLTGIQEYTRAKRIPLESMDNTEIFVESVRAIGEILKYDNGLTKPESIENLQTFVLGQCRMFVANYRHDSGVKTNTSSGEETGIIALKSSEIKIDIVEKPIAGDAYIMIDFKDTIDGTTSDTSWRGDRITINLPRPIFNITDKQNTIANESNSFLYVTAVTYRNLTRFMPKLQSGKLGKNGDQNESEFRILSRLTLIDVASNYPRDDYEYNNQQDGEIRLVMRLQNESQTIKINPRARTKKIRRENVEISENWETVCAWRDFPKKNPDIENTIVWSLEYCRREIPGEDSDTSDKDGTNAVICVCSQKITGLYAVLSVKSRIDASTIPYYMIRRLPVIPYWVAILGSCSCLIPVLIIAASSAIRNLPKIRTKRFFDRCNRLWTDQESHHTASCAILNLLVIHTLNYGYSKTSHAALSYACVALVTSRLSLALTSLASRRRWPLRHNNHRHRVAGDVTATAARTTVSYGNDDSDDVTTARGNDSGDVTAGRRPRNGSDVISATACGNGRGVFARRNRMRDVTLHEDGRSVGDTRRDAAAGDVTKVLYENDSGDVTTASDARGNDSGDVIATATMLRVDNRGDVIGRSSRSGVGIKRRNGSGVEMTTAITLLCCLAIPSLCCAIASVMAAAAAESLDRENNGVVIIGDANFAFLDTAFGLITVLYCALHFAVGKRPKTTSASRLADDDFAMMTNESSDRDEPHRSSTAVVSEAAPSEQEIKKTEADCCDECFGRLNRDTALYSASLLFVCSATSLAQHLQHPGNARGTPMERAGNRTATALLCLQGTSALILAAAILYCRRLNARNGDATTKAFASLKNKCRRRDSVYSDPTATKMAEDDERRPNFISRQDGVFATDYDYNDAAQRDWTARRRDVMMLETYRRSPRSCPNPGQMTNEEEGVVCDDRVIMDGRPEMAARSPLSQSATADEDDGNPNDAEDREPLSRLDIISGIVPKQRPRNANNKKRRTRQLPRQRRQQRPPLEEQQEDANDCAAAPTTSLPETVSETQIRGWRGMRDANISNILNSNSRRSSCGCRNGNRCTD